MAALRKDPGPRDLTTINMSGESEIRWWCKQLGCTRNRLVEAIKVVGPMTYRVQQYLADETESRWRRPAGGRMPEPPKTIPADPKRIDISSAEEVRYWCQRLKCSHSQLRATIRIVGPMLNDVRSALGIH
jgi:hypothetical protein